MKMAFCDDFHQTSKKKIRKGEQNLNVVVELKLFLKKFLLQKYTKLRSPQKYEIELQQKVQTSTK